VKIAITGASGFIGRHVLECFSQNQADVVAVTRDASRLQNLPAGVRVVQLDIAKPGEDCFVRLGCPDILIHLAWDGLPNYKSLHHFESELPKQYRFLKMLIEAGLPNLLISGTCFEYGMQAGELSEDVFLLPNNTYGYAKNALRQHLEFLKSVKPFNLVWLRLFYIYGDGQLSTSLYQSFKEALLRGDKTFNMSGGEQLRDYLPITEVARIIVHLSMNFSDLGAVNLCSGEPVSVRRLVEKWLMESHSEMKLNLGYYPYPDYEPMAFWGNRQRLDTFLENL
jgi:dTDP-6-deoxy-L-talose 4-dehydrogenase (NAD+)